MRQHVTFEITGDERMHCDACARRVVRSLGMLEGVIEVAASPVTQQVDVDVDPAVASVEQVGRRLEALGYRARRV